MKLIFKTVLALFTLFLAGTTLFIIVSDVDIPQTSVVKTIPNEKIL